MKLNRIFFFDNKEPADTDDACVSGCIESNHRFIFIYWILFLGEFFRFANNCWQIGFALAHINDIPESRKRPHRVESTVDTGVFFIRSSIAKSLRHISHRAVCSPIIWYFVFYADIGWINTIFIIIFHIIHQYLWTTTTTCTENIFFYVAKGAKWKRRIKTRTQLSPSVQYTKKKKTNVNRSERVCDLADLSICAIAPIATVAASYLIQ